MPELNIYLQSPACPDFITPQPFTFYLSFSYLNSFQTNYKNPLHILFFYNFILVFSSKLVSDGWVKVILSACCREPGGLVVKFDLG
jgi:hypothetical protein